MVHYNFLWSSGITYPQYRALLTWWLDYGCAVCGRLCSKPPQIDHSHATGRVRGLLCSPCNVAIGMFNDDKTRLKNAIRYLEQAAPQSKDVVS